MSEAETEQQSQAERVRVRDEFSGPGWGVACGLCLTPIAGILVLLLVLTGVAHWVAYLTIAAVVTGTVVSLVDRTWSFITVPISVGLVLVALVAMLGGLADAIAWLWTVVFVLSALVGAVIGRAIQGSRRARAAGVIALSGLILAPFITAEVGLRLDAHRFLTQRRDDVQDAIEAETVRLPKTDIRWHHALMRRLRCLSVNAEWESSPSSAGVGDCTLKTEWRLWLDEPASDCLRRAMLAYRPRTPAQLRSAHEAEQLLRELGVQHLPGKLEKRPSGNAPASWTGSEGCYEFTVTADGHVQMRLVPLSDSY